MKYVTFEVAGPTGRWQRVGALESSAVVDLAVVMSEFLCQRRNVSYAAELTSAIVRDMRTLINCGSVGTELVNESLQWFRQQGSPARLHSASTTHEASTVRLLAPVPNPLSIRDALTYEAHAKAGWARRGQELPAEWYELPIHYRTSHTSVAGPDDPIIWPSYSKKLDYELEIAACVGIAGSDLTTKDADRHIFGYTIFNDVSARDVQYREMQVNLGPCKGKNFRNANIMGPCLVTADEIDPSRLAVIVRVNGEEWASSTTSGMQHSFAELLAYASRSEAVHAGEFFCSGTVPQGCGADIDRWLEAEDVLELQVEGIGTLRNRVQKPQGEEV